MEDTSRLFNRGFVFGLAILAICALGVPATFAATVPPGDVEKYSNELLVPTNAGLVVDMTRGGRITVDLKNTTQQVLGTKTATAGGGPFPLTPLYGYDFGGGTTYPGATILARKDRRIVVRWNNMLDNDAVAFPDSHLLSYLVDPTLHMAFPDHGVPVVTHLHGGHTESASDGLPEQWYTQGFAEMGDFFVKRDYLYGNDQNAATLWYHDHALGITRLNVYAGLAGFYLLTDANEQNLQDNNVLPSGDFDAEIVIQDRQFEIVDNVARLTLPAEFEAEDDPLPDIFNILCEDDGSPGWKEADEFPEETPSAVAEFFGDIIVVNGRAWPMYEVGQTKYRLRLLNGSDSRFYVLEFRDTATGAGFTYDFLVIGSDQGFLPAAITQSELLIAPGERYDVVFDFSSQGLDADDSVYLRNFGPDEPFKGIPQTPADEGSTGQIMRFDVKSTTTIPVPTTPPPVAGGTLLNVAAPDLTPDANGRPLVLFEGRDNFGRLQPLLGTLGAGSLTWSDAITENPALNATERWEVYNATEDAHPIHIHLVKFQIENREDFDGVVLPKAQPQHDFDPETGFGLGQGGLLVGPSGVLGTAPELLGGAEIPYAREAGWKDTAVMLPGQVTRVISKFDKPGRYVWHCHILSHEDHEMMRPYYIGGMP